MLNIVFRLLLTSSVTFWIAIIYAIKTQWTFCDIFPPEIAGLVLMLIPIALSGSSLLVSGLLEKDSIQGCRECSLADNDFLPVYLGYFFVSLSVNDIRTLCFICAIVFVFTFLTQTQYFNPVFLLFGYHFYHVITSQGTKAFLVVRGKIIRKAQDVNFTNMTRINDTTYIVAERIK